MTNQKQFNEGQRVRLLAGAVGVLDGEDAEVIVPIGSMGTITQVRETPNPDCEQGAYLYDVEFSVHVDGVPALVWCIYDATDAHEIEKVEAAQ
jgi:hypothetical protein